MGRFGSFLFTVFVIAGIGAILWFNFRPDEPAPAPPAVTADEAAPVIASEPPAPPPAAEPEYRIPEPPADAPPSPPLPVLNDSDAAVRGELEAIAGREPVGAWLIQTGIIQRWVVFIDSLDREGVPLIQRPARSVPGLPVIEKQPDGRLVLGAGNARRYDAVVRVFAALDTARLVGFYFHYYPLFQRAYAQIGTAPPYFNTRLLQVIEHLLATPELSGPIELVRPKVLYRYADADIEALSFGQKTLLRAGSDNAATIKAKLREIRVQIIARAQSVAN